MHRREPTLALRITLTLIFLAGLLSVIALAPALADAKKKGGARLVPPKGKVYTGVSDTGQTSDFTEFTKKTRSHPAILQSFETFGSWRGEPVRRWEDTRTRGMLSISTAGCWGCKPVHSSKEIGDGDGDAYLLRLNAELAKLKKPIYIRLFPEMNGFWNPYSAFHGSGKAKGSEHSTKNFIRAWRRTVLVTRGGKVGKINKKLKRLGLPKLAAKKKKLPRPKVHFAWVPQSHGTPNVKGNQPGAYFPGYKYVDWVGADIYGKFPNFAGLNSLYKRYDKRPFMIGEWAPWGVDDPGFVKDLFDFVGKKGRAKMIVYYQGFGEGSDNEFEVTDNPLSLLALRSELNGKRLLSTVPEHKRKKNKKKR